MQNEVKLTSQYSAVVFCAKQKTRRRGTMNPSALTWFILLSHSLITTHCVKGNTMEDFALEHSDNSRYQVLEDGTVLRFTSKPPLYDITKQGTTTWYPCVAEVVQPSNTTTTPARVAIRWVIPEGVPKLNHSGGDWPHLQGHGYFVDTDSNNTLVLVHPEVTDEGRYICQAELKGMNTKAHMQLHVIFYDRGFLPTQTAHGFLGVAVILGVIGAAWLFDRHVIDPYIQKQRKRRRIAVISEEKTLDEVQPSLQDV